MTTDVLRASKVKTKQWLKQLEVKMQQNSTNNALKVKQTTRKLPLLFMEDNLQKVGYKQQL